MRGLGGSAELGWAVRRVAVGRFGYLGALGEHINRELTFFGELMAFSYRKLIVYERALQYDTLVAELIPMIRQQDRSLADHLERSTASRNTR